MACRLLFLLLVSAVPAYGQGSVAGRVTDIDSGAPLADVRLALCPADGDAYACPHEVLTDADGQFSLSEAGPGRWRLVAEHYAGAVHYLLVGGPLPEGAHASSLLFHVQIPASPEDRLVRQASPKSLSMITGLLEDGHLLDVTDPSRPHVVPGTDVFIERCATGVLTGRVRHGRTPVTGAGVDLAGSTLRGLTDAEGRFTLRDVPPGTYALRITAPPDTLLTPAVDVRPGLNTINVDLSGL